jgi:hypothetical protein
LYMHNPTRLRRAPQHHPRQESSETTATTGTARPGARVGWNGKVGEAHDPSWWTAWAQAINAAPDVADEESAGATGDSPRHHDWAELCAAHPVLVRHCGHPFGEPVPPPPLDVADVVRFVAACRHPTLGPILCDALGALLADDIAEAIGAAVPNGGQRG